MIAPPGRTRRAACWDHDGAAAVGAVDPVEVSEIERRDRREEHDACRVHDDVDPAELRLHRVERVRHGSLVGDVAADRNRAAARGNDRGNGLVGFRLVAGVVHAEGEPVFCKSLDDGASDAAGPSGDEGDPGDLDSGIGADGAAQGGYAFCCTAVVSARFRARRMTPRRGA